MPNPITLTPSNATAFQRATQQVQDSENKGFDALLDSIGTSKRASDRDDIAKDPLGSLIDSLLNNLTTARSNDNTAKNASLFPAKYALTDSFTSTFGSDGPLIDFINEVTSKLGLSATQNASLQQIAVNNKDATRSSESVRKIAGELKQAGIG